ncbi:SURF1 family cytochrome oxidase biogenesis protein [Cellulomonas palmilytica]|uniref:SURF1 family cytochrome oxidase biogenesis protein n=1 Tax=Cellulomonas palmilytica TaxID=2608402 RepID=UPI001F39646B|nr:SURF1 family protein [Cellulomonas palmilytica]UJP38844.1 SURF1 family protein [Cellulomonas palmilytica]
MSPARRRAVVLVLVGVLVAVACTFLGRWQWHRHEWRDARIATVERNYDATPVPLADVLPSTDAALADDDEWSQVRVVGTYLPDATVLLRNRPVGGTPAYHVLVPFRVAPTGGVLVVDRGWVPTGADASADVDVPPPPAGEVVLVARVRQAESATDRGAPAGSVQAIHPAQVMTAAGLADEPVFTGAFGQSVTEEPAATSTLGALPAPDLDPGSHLSYAFQWWAFALGGLVGFTWLARRELVEERDGTGAPFAPGPGTAPAAPVRPARPRRREGRAEAEEDALIDAQTSDDASRTAG